MTQPQLSVLMAVSNNAATLAAAMASVLDQTMRDLELVVSDDGSEDKSLKIAQEMATSDARVRIASSPSRRGPGAARNAALDLATGEWIGVVDADDLVHPLRFERLLAAAETLHADAVADDQILFSEAGGLGSLAGPLDIVAPLRIDPVFFVRANTEGSGLPPLGYLKPLIRRDALGACRYDEATQIGEDYHFLLEILLDGADMRLLPEAWYFYRRHAASISHRFSVDKVEAMQDAHTRHRPKDPPADLETALAARAGALQAAASYEHLVADLKARHGLRAARRLLSTPGLLRPLARSLAERRARKAAPTPRRPKELWLAEGAVINGVKLPAAGVTLPAHDTARLIEGLATAVPTYQVADAAGLSALALFPDWRRAVLADTVNTDAARPFLPHHEVDFRAIDTPDAPASTTRQIRASLSLWAAFGVEVP